MALFTSNIKCCYKAIEW